MSTTPAEGTCQQHRPLFAYEYQHQTVWGPAESTNYELCSRCWERAETARASDCELDLPLLVYIAEYATPIAA
ncbi:hypothetical protein [Kitasatospora griseola]|uniref:hypothetical protein n=1 Tax=Kitasatospora griseola TaxID=2064 RepID=UPI0036682130